MVIEVQVTQEYLGQQRHVCFTIPMWKEVFDFDMRVANANTPIKSIVNGKLFNRPLGGFVAVVNVGLDLNWLGHDFAMANLYGFGRLAWNPNLTSAQIVDEWTRLTFSSTNETVINTINSIQLNSWPAYENYSGMRIINLLYLKTL